jgi:uncharacterized phage protein (TIGR02220 family)
MIINKAVRRDGNLQITEVDGEETARDLISYISIPAWILDRDISRNAMLLYGLLNSFNINHRKIFASDEWLGKSLHLSKRSIQKLLRELQKEELVAVSYVDEHKRNRSEIFCINPVYEDNKIRYAEQRNAIRRTTQRDAQDSVHTNKVTNKVTNKNIYNQSSDSGFDIFLKEFNKVMGRSFRGDSKAKRQYRQRLREGYTLNDFQIALEGLKGDEYHRDTKYKYATPEFITRADKLERYLNSQQVAKKKRLTKEEKELAILEKYKN